VTVVRCLYSPLSFAHQHRPVIKQPTDALVRITGSFDAVTDLDGVPAGYQDMADRKSLKILIKP
jgi:hypothetical protein